MGIILFGIVVTINMKWVYKKKEGYKTPLPDIFKNYSYLNSLTSNVRKPSTEIAP